MADLRKVRKAAVGRGKKAKNRQLQYCLWIGGFCGSIVLACIVLIVNPNKGPFETLVNDENLLWHVNRNAKTWRASASAYFEGWMVGHVRQLDGIGISPMGGAVAPCVVPESPVPEQFDARARWPQCFRAPPPRQGNCTASWAIATSSAMSNRFCISDPDAYSEVMLSPQHLLSCDKANRGCSGGDIDTVWKFIESQGLVSEACFPYEASSEVSCQARCTSERPLRAASHCVLSDEAAVRREIFLSGPVVAPLFLVDDFLVYQGGLYQEMTTATQLTSLASGRNRIVHAVKILGWGNMEGKPYWLIENSFGDAWGEKGFAKVLRGGNPEKKGDGGVLLESYIMAGIPSSRFIQDVRDDDDFTSDSTSDSESDPNEG